VAKVLALLVRNFGNQDASLLLLLSSNEEVFEGVGEGRGWEGPVIEARLLLNKPILGQEL
jgi:hypothetical protein